MRKAGKLSRTLLALAAAAMPAGVALADCAELKGVVAKLEAMAPPEHM